MGLNKSERDALKVLINAIPEHELKEAIAEMEQKVKNEDPPRPKRR